MFTYPCFTLFVCYRISVSNYLYVLTKNILLAFLVDTNHFVTISTKSSILDVGLDSECVSASFFTGSFYILREESFVGKNGKNKELIFANVWWNFAKQSIAFTKKIRYVISFNKKMKWLKFLFTSLLKAKNRLLSKGSK